MRDTRPQFEIILDDLRKLYLAQMSPYLIMGIGIPGSGKTTYLESIEDKLGIQRVCPDDIREELTGSASDQSSNKEVSATAKQRIRTAINGSFSAIIDGTHTIGKYRVEDIEQYRNMGARAIIGTTFDVPYNIAFARNLQRDRVVPESVMIRMSNQLAVNPVDVSEGYDILFKIQDEDQELI